MKRALLALLAVCVAAALATAGQNPGIRVYMDFDPPNYVHEVYPAPFTMVNAYLVLDMFGGDPAAGMMTVSMYFHVDDGTSVVTIYESLLDGGIAPPGEWEAGVTLVALDCAQPDGSVPANNGIVVAAVARMLYSGTPGSIRIMDHPDYPRWVTDCSDPAPNVDLYCVLSHGGIGQAPGPPGDCGVTPVSDSSWSAIKAMYK